MCKPCSKKKRKVLQGGSILDRVISQASNQDQCLLYKLANYKKGMCTKALMQDINVLSVVLIINLQ